jgi:glycosyltransferase involved in cell wall biosynthesis
MYIPLVIPAKNEELNLPQTVNSINRMSNRANYEIRIVVVNDGSHDLTSEIARTLGCHVVDLPDRGYSALGTPEMASTINAGFEYIKKNWDGSLYEYVMISGADSVYNEDYLEILLDEMESNSNLVMCAGVNQDQKRNVNSVSGSGRLIKKDFWHELGFKYEYYYSWESYPVIFAHFKNRDAYTIFTAKILSLRAPLMLVDWWNYGVGMKENGSLLLYVVLRAIRRSKVSVKDALRLTMGYIFGGSWSKYPLDMVLYQRKYQKQRMLHKLKIRMSKD